MTSDVVVNSVKELIPIEYHNLLNKIDIVHLESFKHSLTITADSESHEYLNLIQALTVWSRVKVRTSLFMMSPAIRSGCKMVPLSAHISSIRSISIDCSVIIQFSFTFDIVYVYGA